MTSKRWIHYPMGPNLRDYLGITREEYQGEQTADLAPEESDAFAAFLAQEFNSRLPDSGDEALLLIEELVAMRLGSVAMLVGKLCEHFHVEEDFKGALNLGCAYMLESDFNHAKNLFTKAQKIAPEELAPYINMTQVLFHDSEDDDCLEWCIAGLDVDPNCERIWEIVGGVYAHRFGDNAGNEMLRLASQKQSWAGRSLAAQYLAPEDNLFRAELLEELYNEGLRDIRFLVEYTAALGVAQQYEKIPPIVWQAETFSKERLPWQLYAHAAQAQLGLEQKDESQSMLAKALTHPDIPGDVKSELQQVTKEFEITGDEVLH